MSAAARPAEARQPTPFIPVTFVSCTAAFTWRIWRGHRSGLLFLPFGYFGLIAGVTLLAAADPRVINGARQLAATAVQFGVHPGHLAVAVGVAFLVVPVLVSVQLGRMAANSVRAVIGQDRSIGSLELLCASPASRRTLLAGVLTAPLLLAALDWLILTALLVAAGVAAQLTLHVNLGGRPSVVAAVLAAPLPLGVLGGALVLVVAIVRPGLTDQTAGPGSNVLRGVSAMPALVIVALIVLFGRDWGEANIIAGTAIAAAVCYAVVIATLWRIFRPEKIITS